MKENSGVGECVVGRDIAQEADIGLNPQSHEIGQSRIEPSDGGLAVWGVHEECG